MTDDRWQTAVDGLKVFLLAGWGDVAESLGWPRDELYRVPERWSHIHLCGNALLIGDYEVTEVTADAIRIMTASGAIQAFYRRAAPDLGVVSSDEALPKPTKPLSDERVVLSRATDVALTREPKPISDEQRRLVNRWVASRVISWPLDRCLHCRLAIAPGSKWTAVAAGDDLARFHATCHPEWLAQQEAAARRALGLDP